MIQFGCKMLSLDSCLRKAFFYIICLAYGYLVSIITFFSILKHRRQYFQVRKRDNHPGCLKNRDLGEHHTARINDINIHYVAKGNKENPLLLFIHGFPDFWYTWRNQMTHFGDAFYSVALDLRGFNESDKLPYLKSYEIDVVSEDIKEFIKELGKDKATLVGHDLGGSIAIHFTSKYHEMVDKLVLLNATHPRLFWETIQTDWRQFFRSWFVFFFQLQLLPEFIILGKDFAFLENIFTTVNGQPLLSEEEMEAYKYTFARPGAVTCALNYFRANVDSDKIPAVGQKITRPTLLIWGQKSQTMNPVLATGLSKFIDNLNTKFIENAGHFVHLEKPNLVTDSIRDFLCS